MAASAKESFHTMFETMGRHSLALATIGAGLASAIGVSLHIQNIKNEVALQEERLRAQREQRLCAQEERMKAQEERTKALVETAKRETTERLLMYGYAEEFQRYQQKLGLRPSDEPEK